jgi:hypothetical protein
MYVARCAYTQTHDVQRSSDAIARMILRRANQKFNMPKEIGHDGVSKLSLVELQVKIRCMRQLVEKSRDNDVARGRKASPPYFASPCNTTHYKEHQRDAMGSIVSSPRVPLIPLSSISFLQVCHLFILTPKFGTGSCSQSPCHGAKSFIVAILVLIMHAYF